MDNTSTPVVGWIDDGEWLEHEVDAVPGTYRCGARVAGFASTGRIHLELDGDHLATLDVRYTGGWDDWTWSEISTVEIDERKRSVLRVIFEGGSFNVDWIKFW